MKCMSYTVGQKIRAIYWIGVYKPSIGGFRSERVSAELEVISPGRAKVVKAELDSARSNRQWFNVSCAANNQIGAVKLISKLGSIEVIE